MKKLIAILMVLAIVVGAVFADTRTGDGTAIVRVNTSITPEYPAFRLHIETGTSYNAVTNKENSLVVSNDPVEGVVEIDADALDASTKDVTVNFSVQQIQDALCYEKYYFSVVATDLVLTRDETKMTQDQYNALTTAQKTISLTTGDLGATPTITPATVADMTQGDAGAKTSQKYNGIRKEATAQAALTLANFSCKWIGNAEAVPGDYTGTVTLTVSAQ